MICLTPMDLMLATHIVDEINRLNDDFEIKIDNASVRGLNPTINFIMVSGDAQKENAKQAFADAFEEKNRALEETLLNKNRLLEEVGRRADLAENQLMLMNSLVKDSRESTASAKQQLTSLFFGPFMKLIDSLDTPQKN